MTGLVAGMGVKAALGGVPRWAWYAIGGVAAAIALFFLHLHFVHNYRDKIITVNNTAWQKKLDKEHAAAMDWKHKFDQSQTKIAQEIRNRHEETLRNNAIVADDLRLHGPGAARCGQGNHPVAAAGASGSVSRPGQADAAGPAMPPADSAAVPWGWLVGRAEQCDGNRSEVISWRDWYKQLQANWPK